MSLHWVRIIESGHFSTQRLFELGLSFGLCKRKHFWPSLDTMNSFLKGGRDDGTLATEIEWEPCELTQKDYELSVAAFMEGEPYNLDTRNLPWEEWIAEISKQDRV